MLYRVIIPKSAQKDLNKIQSKFKSRIYTALGVLATNSFIGKRLEGKYRGQWSYRVWPYRIIYQIIKKDLVILIIHIGHRQGVYKKNN